MAVSANALALLRARRALSAAGIAAEVPIQAVDSVNNEVWLTPDMVVRINLEPDGRLRREAHLASHLPPEIGYPPVVHQGGDMGSDWLIVQRMPGQPLSRCWPVLSEVERKSAVDQLTARIKLLHQVEVPDLPPLRRTPQGLEAAHSGQQAVAPLLHDIERVSALPNVDKGLMTEVTDLVNRLAPALTPFDPPTLIHGDLTFENVLWDLEGQRITALLDFEWSRPARPDLDLDVLLRFCALPKLHVAHDYEHMTRAEDYELVPWWLAEGYPELFADPLTFDRVRLYSVAWDVREVLAHPPQQPPARLHPHHPHHRLSALVLGTSHLDRLNGTAAV